MILQPFQFYFYDEILFSWCFKHFYDICLLQILAYNRANRAVAILCNHQRSVPKSHETSMSKLKEKIAAKRDQIKEMERHYKDVKREAKNGSAKGKM